MFFCKFNDPLFIKIEKLDILVLAELREYANEVDYEMARRSIRAIGSLCMRLSGGLGRRHPGDYGPAVAALCSVQSLIDEPEARAAFVWICGQYSEHVPDCGSVIASFIDSFLEETAAVQLQILTAAVKLFLLQPQQQQQQITLLLKTATENADNPDVRDRGNISMVASVYHKLPETFVSRLRPAAALQQRDTGRGAPLGAQGSLEDSQEQVVERARKALEQQQQQQQQRGSARSSSRSSSSSRSRSALSDSSEEGPVDLLDLSDSSVSAASSKGCPVPQQLVLKGDTPGAQQQRGLEIRAAFYKPQGGKKP
ncbi:beta adaptin protein, putative [Eimeria brunetti]|uniref:Beta adaptin protein, putative n=1 Tax=Eimeria brunetti TaxID=51314 RepID=U6LV60_9EIME|nr:beta adaptin protein, putative [Eimeria brunetti]